MNSNEISDKTRICVIMIRGRVTARRSVRKTMALLKLHKSNHCVIIGNAPTTKGMLQHSKDYLTWGEVDEATVEMLLRKRGRVVGNRRLTDSYVKENTSFASIAEFASAFMRFEVEISDIPGLKPVFRLRPPRKGFGIQGKKHPFSTGGAAGYRGSKINQLIEKMA